MRLQVTLQPSHERVVELRWIEDDIALLLGTIISILLSGAVFLAQRARRHDAITARANRLFKAEIESKKRVEKMLRENSTFRDAILNGANRLIISTDRERIDYEF